MGMTHTPDEIKKGIKCCHINDVDLCDCESCPFAHKGWQTTGCDITMAEDALALIQQLQAENAELLETVMWMEAERDDFKRTIRQLEAERDIAVKALTVTRDKVEQAHNMLIDDIVHRVDDDTYLVLSNMVGNMLDWPVEDDEHSTQQEED